MSYVTRPNTSTPSPLAFPATNEFHSSSCWCAQLMSPLPSAMNPSSDIILNTINLRIAPPLLFLSLFLFVLLLRFSSLRGDVLRVVVVQQRAVPQRPYLHHAMQRR